MLTGLLLTAGLAQAGSAVALDRIQPVSILLPDSSRESIPERIAITGDWRLVYSAGGVRTWEADLPIRPRSMFFNRAPGDMAMFVGERKLKHSKGPGGSAGSWMFTARSLRVRRPLNAGPPEPGEYTIRYSTATDREKSLNFTQSGLSQSDFTQRSLQIDDTTRHGLFLPAPAEIFFDVVIPEDAVFDLRPVLVPPEAADPATASDGAVLWVAVDGERIGEFSLKLGPGQLERLDLSPWSGQSVRISLSTDPLESTDLDYVFVTDPVIHTPQADPPRMVVIFLDTTRADHLGMYGYERDTTPKLDAWATSAAVFEQARSIAPWTLPSTRTMVTGAMPEYWNTLPTIQERLSLEGWATTFIAGNIYLSSNFEMAEGWGEHRCVNWPIASVQVDRAETYLDEHADRPVMMILHFMDMHLPYTEPPNYRRLFAGDAPPQLQPSQFHLSQVKKAARTMDESGKQYVRDRYDNNLRYVDDQLARFFEHLGPQDTVVVLADHGEEFWDHGGFEHGHTLYDELLRVPMLVSGPGITAGHFTEPVSLLDVSPTLAAAAGVSDAGMSGLSLQDFTARSAEFEDRPLAFGRPLYGSTIWGSLDGGSKYITREGVEQVFDVRTEPGEQTDIVQTSGSQEGREALGDALNTEVHIAYRLTATRTSRSTDVTARLEVPGGVLAAWPAADPTMGSRSEVVIDGESVRMTWEGNTRQTGEIFVVPVEPAEATAASLSLFIGADEEKVPAPSGRRTPWPPTLESQSVLFSGSSERNKVRVGYAVVPLPREGDALLNGTNDENCAELVALGYIEPGGCD